MARTRIESVDIVRGFAVLWMVLFQTLDFFSKDFQLYGSVWHGFLDFVNWLPLFMFVSGVSVWLMVDRRLSLGFSKWKILAHGLKRYGYYIFLSFLLCLWVFNLQIFLNLNEIVIAIGVYAFITLCLLLAVFSREWVFVPLMFLVYGLSFWFRDSLRFQYYPFYWILPFFFMGALSAKLILKQEHKRLEIFEFLLIATLAILVLLSDSFRYVDKTLGFVILNAFLIIVMFYAISKIEDKGILRVFSFAGRNALFFYLFHYAVWAKLAASLGIWQALDWPISILVTCPGVALIFSLAYLESKFLHHIRKKLRYTHKMESKSRIK